MYIVADDDSPQSFLGDRTFYFDIGPSRWAELNDLTGEFNQA